MVDDSALDLVYSTGRELISGLLAMIRAHRPSHLRSRQTLETGIP